MADTIDAQIQRLRDEREQADLAKLQAEQELQDWPKLRHEVRERALPAIRSWSADLAPFRTAKPRKQFVRMVRRHKRDVRRLRWWHAGSWRLRGQAMQLRLLIHSRTILTLLGVVLIVTLLVLAFLYRDALGALFSDLFTMP